MYWFAMGNKQSSPIEEEVGGATQDRPLPEDSLDQEGSLLSSFSCPFQERSQSPYCMSVDCPFGHHSNLPTQAELRPVPWYVCLDRLLNQCESTQIEYITTQLVRCENGLHPSIEDLTDMHQLEEKFAIAVLTGKHLVESKIKPPKCTSCKKAIALNGFCGLLECCSCRLCNMCVERWGYQCTIRVPRDWTAFTCKTCTIASPRILLWPQPFCSRAYQQYLFGMQKRCFGVVVGATTTASIHDNDNRDMFSLSFKGHVFSGNVRGNNRAVPPVNGRDMARGDLGRQGRTVRELHNTRHNRGGNATHGKTNRR